MRPVIVSVRQSVPERVRRTNRRESREIPVGRAVEPRAGEWRTRVQHDGGDHLADRAAASGRASARDRARPRRDPSRAPIAGSGDTTSLPYEATVLEPRRRVGLLAGPRRTQRPRREAQDRHSSAPAHYVGRDDAFGRHRFAGEYPERSEPARAANTTMSAPRRTVVFAFSLARRLRSTERSDGRKRPEWKDGSRRLGELVPARTSTDAATNNALKAHSISPTRNRRDNAEANAVAPSFRRDVEVRLAPRPYGREFKRPIASTSETDIGRYVA